MDDRIYLVDAMAFAFRAFHAIKTTLTDPEGRPTNALYGFTRILLKLMREHTPSHIAVVFDAPGPTFRDEMFAEYKANRKETPPELKEQFPRMHELVKALNLPLLSVPGVEADDVIGTLALKAAAKGMEAVIVSGDKDLMQLIGGKVRMFDPGKGESGVWYGPDDVVERFGVGPERVPDALALIGDAADNVPGVRGIGEVTAKKLMAQYGTLEALYKHVDDLKGKQRENIEAGRGQAFASRELVIIKTDVPLEVDPDGCHRKPWDPERVREAFSKLGFNSLIDETGVADKKETLDYTLVTDEAQLKRVVEEMRAAGRFSVDTETTSTEPMFAELVGISLSCKEAKGYYIPVGHAPDALALRYDPDDLLGVELMNQIPRARTLELLRPLLEDASTGKIGHNIKYDMIVFHNAGVEMQGVAMDTMVASYLTDPGRLRHNLDEVSLHYLRRKTIPISDLIGKGSKSITFDQVPIDRACEYATEDADMAWRLAAVLEPVLRERELSELFQNVELPLIGVLARMEEAGIALDTGPLDLLRTEIGKRLAELEGLIHESAGGPFNINSPKQLQEILFERLGLRTVRKTKTGQSTDVDVLEELAAEHPLPKLILEYRSLEKLRGTYVDALPRLVHPRTGRIHTSFNQAVAATGRLSSSNPNLQNIPVRTEYGKRIREAFVPGNADMLLISADYSQIELRILAHLSGDTAMLQAFAENADIHRDTAARVFGVAPEQVTPEMRRQAKAVNFGVVYGISDFGLARNLGIGRGQAARFIDAYFRQYPRVRGWLDEVVAKAKIDGYTTTMLNRRRYLPELNGADAAARKSAERMALNTPVQGTAADVIKVAMVRLDAALRGTGARMLLQVHDELVVEAPADAAKETAALMVRVMEQAVEIDVPLRVDAGIGKNWAEIH
jgi:DNA polymerase-1